MVEAAFMAPMFVILWFVALYAHNLGSTKISLNSKARAQAWDYALANCDQGQGDTPTTPADWGVSETPGPLTPVPGSPPTQPPSQGGSNPNSQVMGQIAGFLGNLFTNPEGSHSVQNGNVNFRVPNLYDHTGGTTSKQLASTVVLFCNEKAQDGSFSEILSAIFGLLFNFSP